ncbi:hypothetical protein B0J17DRAFT_772931 [Rhizoctonia solani]|nr:hypothetical protein B0J17DRAFT_772931 [Rhizoctonia solani]
MLKYTGFVSQTSVARTESSTTHVSSKVGDSASMQFNGSTLLLHGPCGPTGGLMRVTINSRQETINTSRPFMSNDCLLFQAWGLPLVSFHQLLIENVDGSVLAIDRVEFFRLLMGIDNAKPTIAILCVVVGVVIVCAVAIIVYTRRVVKREQEGGRLPVNWSRSMLLVWFCGSTPPKS